MCTCFGVQAFEFADVLLHVHPARASIPAELSHILAHGVLELLAEVSVQALEQPEEAVPHGELVVRDRACNLASTTT